MDDFDQQMVTYYSFLSDDTWREAVEKARAVAKTVNAEIEQRCRELNIPRRFAPRLQEPYWVGNDMSYRTRGEKAEFRQAAASKVDAMKKQAVTEITRRSVEAQEKILVPGLTSAIAQKLLATIPKVTDLMPTLDIRVVAKLIGKDDNAGSAEDD